MSFFTLGVVRRTIPEIIEKCGGYLVCASVTGLKNGPEKWERGGIPDRHWAALMALVPSLTPRELYGANLVARLRESNRTKGGYRRPKRYRDGLLIKSQGVRSK